MYFKFHHIGIVVSSIEQYERQMLPLLKVSEVIDEIQNSKLSLYKNDDNSYIELIEPLNEKSTSFNSLKKSGVHLNHLCYEVKTLSELDSYLSEKKWLKVFGPVPARLFNNREVIFYINRTGQLIEFLLSE
jgi:hypothetical protein